MITIKANTAASMAMIVFDAVLPLRPRLSARIWRLAKMRAGDTTCWSSGCHVLLLARGGSSLLGRIVIVERKGFGQKRNKTAPFRVRRARYGDQITSHGTHRGHLLAWNSSRAPCLYAEPLRIEVINANITFGSLLLGGVCEK
jgi:hypothetical protein